MNPPCGGVVVFKIIFTHMHTVKNLLHNTAMLIVTAMLLAAGGCSSTDTELMELVPASAQAVIVTNLTKVMDEAGYTTAPRTMPKWITGGTDMLGNSNEAAKALDLNHLVAFAMNGSNFATIAKVRSETGLTTLATNAGFTRADNGGYTVWKGADLDIAVKDHVAWIGPEALTMAQLAEAKRKNDGNYTLWKGLTEFINTENAMSAVVCLEGTDASQKGKYVCVELNGNDEAASIDFCLMQADGEKIKNDALTVMQTDFLRYLPRNFNTALAIGTSPKFNWDKIAEIVESIGGGQARGTFDSVMDLLKQCDGTIAVAADGYTLATGTPAIMTMIHLPQEKVDSVLKDVIGQFSSVGIPAKVRPDGQTELAIPNMKVFVGSVDGYLAIGTQPFVADQNNSFTTTFEGQCGAAVMQLETLRTFHLGLDYGIDVRAQMGETDSKIKMTFPGSNDRPLANLISLLSIFL